MTMSSSAGLSSMFMLYLNPEHPPGSTAIRSPALSGETFSSAMNFLTSAAADSVTVRVMGLVCCVVAIAILQSRANLDSSFGQVNSLAARLPPLCDLRSPTGRSSRWVDCYGRLLGVPFCRTARCFAAGSRCSVRGPAHELRHPWLGWPRDGEEPPAGLRCLEGRGAVDRGRGDRPDVRDLDARGA